METMPKIRSEQERDIAHEADIRELMREQLEANFGGDMADEDGWPADEDIYFG